MLWVLLGFLPGAWAKRCEYASGPALEGQSPEYEDLVAVVAADNDVASRFWANEAKDFKKKLKTKWGVSKDKEAVAKAVRLVALDGETRLDTAFCKRLCDQDGHECLGYVVNNPWDKSEATPNCWLIPRANARLSTADPELLHLKPKEQKGYGDERKGIGKAMQTHVKVSCGCQARVLHFQRDPLLNQVWVAQEKHRTIMAKYASEQANRPGAVARAMNPSALDDWQIRVSQLAAAVQDTRVEVEGIESRVKTTQFARDFAGVYEFVPMYVPHFTPKRKDHRFFHGILGSWVANFNATLERELAHQDRGSMWKAKIRVSDLYKHEDNAHFLYKCKTLVDDDAAAVDKVRWYVTTEPEVSAWFKTFAEQRAMEFKSLTDLSESKKLMIAAWLGMTCIGTELPEMSSAGYDFEKFALHPMTGADGDASHEVLARPLLLWKSFAARLTASPDPDSARTAYHQVDSMCFASQKKAMEQYEAYTLQEIQRKRCVAADPANVRNVRECPKLGVRECQANAGPDGDCALLEPFRTWEDDGILYPWGRAAPLVHNCPIPKDLGTFSQPAWVAKQITEKTDAWWKTTIVNAHTAYAAARRGGSALASGIRSLTSGVTSRVSDWWAGRKTEENSLGPIEDLDEENGPDVVALEERDFAALDRAEFTSLLTRVKGLSAAGHQVLQIMRAIEVAEDDPELSLVCADSVLKVVQDLGGIMPKISQNLAMRPDLVENDLVRKKLEETQSTDNDLKAKADLLEFYSTQYEDPPRPVELTVPCAPEQDRGPGTTCLVPFGDTLEYYGNVGDPQPAMHMKGSVGQVDSFQVKRTPQGALFLQTLAADHDVCETKPGHTEPCVYDVVEFRKQRMTHQDFPAGVKDRATFCEEVEGGHCQYKPGVVPPEGSIVVVKTVFRETEKQYQFDWLTIAKVFSLAGRYLPRAAMDTWQVLAPLKISIFDEFDLSKEAQSNILGVAYANEFTTRLRAGAFRSLPSDVTVAVPSGIPTSSKYAMVQTRAAGIPLSSLVEDIRGQHTAVLAWRQSVYATILYLYGFLAVEKGFFQADPHNGNWFWHEPSRTLTLIDWGGVGSFDAETRCLMANLYSAMAKKIDVWHNGWQVQVEAAPGHKVPEKALAVTGSYERNGVSLYMPDDPTEAIFKGRTFATSYTRYADGDSPEMNLMFDGKAWRIAETDKESSTMHTDLVEHTVDPAARADLEGKDAHRLEGRNRWLVEPTKDGQAAEIAVSFRPAYADEGAVQDWYVQMGQQLGLLVDVVPECVGLGLVEGKIRCLRKAKKGFQGAAAAEAQQLGSMGDQTLHRVFEDPDARLSLGGARPSAQDRHSNAPNRPPLRTGSRPDSVPTSFAETSMAYIRKSALLDVEVAPTGSTTRSAESADGHMNYLTVHADEMPPRQEEPRGWSHRLLAGATGYFTGGGEEVHEVYEVKHVTHIRGQDPKEETLRAAINADGKYEIEVLEGVCRAKMESGRPVDRGSAAPCESFALQDCGRAETDAQDCAIGSRRKPVVIELEGECVRDWEADPRWQLLGPKTKQFFKEPKRWMKQQRPHVEEKGCVADAIMEALLQEAANSVAFLLAAYDMDLLQVAKFALNAKNSLGTLKPVVEDKYVLLARCVLVFQGMLAQIVTDNMVSLPLSLNQYLVTTTQDRYFRSWESFADNAIGQLAPATVDEDQPMCAAWPVRAELVREQAALRD